MTRFFTALCLLLCIGASAHAEMQQLRVVGVGMDVSASTAEAKALDYAKKRAVYLVARKLPVEKVSDRLARLKPEQFDEIVRGASVLRTKREGTTTYAEVSVSVLDNVLKRALGLEEGESREFGEIPANMRGVLVLPVYVKNARPYLWERENDLREPLRQEVLRQGHGAVLVPASDLDDLRLIDYQNALSVKAAELEPMFTRYGAEEIVIAIFTLGDAEKDSGILLRRLSAGSTRSEVIKLQSDDMKKPSLPRFHSASKLIAGAIVQIASSTAEDEQKRLEKATKIPVDFRYANPRELAKMQESLRSAPHVLTVKIPSISLADIDGIVYLEGEPQKLRDNLIKAGMIVRVAGETWQLSYR